MLLFGLKLLGAAAVLLSAWAAGRLFTRVTPLPRVTAFALGSAAASLAVFLLLAGRQLSPLTLAMAGALLCSGWFLKPRWIHATPVQTLSRQDLLALAVPAAVYAVYYLVHALAPEIQPDGVTYHLGLAREALELGRFPRRTGFFEVLPQGLEMLFVPAIAIGGYPAAKLVHLAFLIATFPLLIGFARRMGLPDRAGVIAGLLYAMAPVTGLSATAAYNDAATVFFWLAAAYAVAVWIEYGGWMLLVAAGWTAGFVYSVKPSGAVLLPAALFFVWRRARFRGVLAYGVAAAFGMAPFVLKAWRLTGNPFAPLFNSIFPNPAFHLFIDRNLAETWRNYPGFHWWSAPWDLAVTGNLQGILGPLALLAPLSLLGLRSGEERIRRAAAWAWAAAAIAALPWLTNNGTRFLMPALACAAFATAACLGRRAALAVVALQAAVCWPYAVDRYIGRGGWHLSGFPWRAALSLETEDAYLSRVSDDYQLAKLVESRTQPGERVLSFVSLATAYLDRPVIDSWQHADGQRLVDTIKLAAFHDRDPFYDLRADWPARPLTGVRIRVPADHPGEWCLHEVHLWEGEELLRPDASWELDARPNPWETPSAFDHNLASRWRSWEPMRKGHFVEVSFPQARQLSSVTYLSHTPVYKIPFLIEGRGVDGRWSVLTEQTRALVRPKEDLRLAAASYLRAQAVRWVVIPSGGGGFGPIGELVEGHEADWGLEHAARLGAIHLFKVLTPSEAAMSAAIARP